jgi:hypothetical protein
MEMHKNLGVATAQPNINIMCSHSLAIKETISKSVLPPPDETNLRKALDCVNHDILLNKLGFYGITGGFFQLIKTYLQDRYQRVVLNNNYFTSISDWSEITHGVPQGSILGPLLFLLYINDLQHSIDKNNKIVLFADDTSLIISNPDPINFRDYANKILQHIHKWFNANLISLNWEKTNFMHFTTKNNLSSNFDVIYKDKKLTTVDSIKFLGLTLDNSPSWKKHIETIVPKLSAAAFAMRVVQSFLSLDSLKLIYYSYFHSILTYGIIFWGNMHHSNVIFKMQKRIIRIMVGIRNRDSCREYFKRLKILPLQSQHLLSLLLFVTDNGDYFRLNSEIHSFNNKNKLNLHPSPSKLTVFQKGPYYSGIKAFNNLPSYFT